MAIEKKPFTPYKLEDDREKDRIKITVSLNKKEQEDIEHIMKDLDLKSPSVALKFAALAGKNAFHQCLGCKDWEHVVRRDRARASDYTKVKIGMMR